MKRFVLVERETLERLLRAGGWGTVEILDPVCDPPPMAHNGEPSSPDNAPRAALRDSEQQKGRP